MSERMARRRVKLYALNNERQWDDRGTGHVTSTYVERLKGMSLLVRAELDGTPLLESKIQTDTAYQKQQGTLIVWSEGDNFDLALSFQEKAGCDEIWEKICQVQGKDPSVEITQDIVDESEEERFEEVNDSGLWDELPPCDLSKLDQINELISASMHNVNKRDKLATAIENECYIKKLLDLFSICEDLKNTEALHTLYEIFKNIILLNKNSFLEVLFADENIFQVVGALEYDPAYPYPKKHREFLKSLSTFKEVIPLENSELINKIHQTYRVQYIQDVALPNQAVFEENMPSTLSSFIFFNKVEIVTIIQEDERFLNELFDQLSSEDVSVEKRRDLILFLKEFCTFSQTLQPPNRENFYKTLSSFGVLGALECTLAIDDPVIKAASVDVLGFFVEFSPSMVREYMLQQQHKVEEEHYLMKIMLEQMVMDCDPEMGGAVQLMGILRILIDPENMLATNNKAERADFLSFFYKHCMHYLVAPVMSNTMGEVVVREDYQTAQLLALILELLAFCLEHHTYHIKNYLIHRDLLRRVLVLMKSKHTFLVLSAVRFIRKIIGMRDHFYNRHIVALNLFAPIVEAYLKNNSRYNLLDSAILELFEFIKTEDVKSLTMYTMEKFGDVFNRIEYVQTFSTLRTRYIQHLDKVRDREKANAAVESLGVVRSGPAVNSGRFRRDIRDMDAEEELWFRSDDDCEEEYGSPLKQELLKSTAEDEDDAATDVGTLLAANTVASLMPAATSMQPRSPEKAICEKLVDSRVICEKLVDSREDRLGIRSESKSPVAAVTVTHPCSPQSGISLVAYDDNSDDEEEPEEGFSSSSDSAASCLIRESKSLSPVTVSTTAADHLHTSEDNNDCESDEQQPLPATTTTTTGAEAFDADEEEGSQDSDVILKLKEEDANDTATNIGGTNGTSEHVSEEEESEEQEEAATEVQNGSECSDQLKEEDDTNSSTKTSSEGENNKIEKDRMPSESVTEGEDECKGDKQQQEVEEEDVSEKEAPSIQTKDEEPEAKVSEADDEKRKREPGVDGAGVAPSTNGVSRANEKEEAEQLVEGERERKKPRLSED